MHIYIINLQNKSLSMGYACLGTQILACFIGLNFRRKLLLGTICQHNRPSFLCSQCSIIAFNNKMKPLSQLKLNKCSIIGASQKQMQKQKGKSKRPALDLLNLLNNKLSQQNFLLQYKKDMQVLKQQNQHLKIVNDDLTRELDVQKRLRKVWNKEEVIIYEDIQAVKKELQEIKSRYLHYK